MAAPSSLPHQLLNPATCRCTPEARKGMVHTQALFRGASASTLADLDFLMRARSLRAGEAVTPTALTQPVFGLVVRGTVKVERWITLDEVAILEVLGPGDLFLHGDSPEGPVLYRASDRLTAMTTTCVLTMPCDELNPLLARDPVLGPRISWQLVRRLSQTEDRMSRLMVETAEHRLAYLLMYLTTKGTTRPKAPGLIPFNVTRKDLAALAGITLETASRILSAWEKREWLRSGRGWIEIRDAGALRQLGSVT